MTLNELKEIIRITSLSHVDINTFDYGEAFEAATDGNYNYPAVFLELPFLIDYDIAGTEKTINFAINVFDQTEFDSLDKDYNAFSKAEVIGDAIFAKLRNDNKTLFRFDSINALTFRNLTDDDLAGVRYDVTITTKREFCGTAYSTEFKEYCEVV